jgi:hypothetical protein
MFSYYAAKIRIDVEIFDVEMCCLHRVDSAMMADVVGINYAVNFNTEITK